MFGLCTFNLDEWLLCDWTCSVPLYPFEFITKQDKLTKGLGVSLAKTPLVLLLPNKTDYSQKRVLHHNFFLCMFGCLSFVFMG